MKYLINTRFGRLIVFFFNLVNLPLKKNDDIYNYYYNGDYIIIKIFYDLFLICITLVIFFKISKIK